jgi:hypothetical protein
MIRCDVGDVPKRPEVSPPMPWKRTPKIRLAVAGGAVAAALAGGAVTLAGAASASPERPIGTPASARLVGFNSQHTNVAPGADRNALVTFGLPSQVDLGDDEAAANNAVRAAGDAAISSLEGDGSIDASQAGRLRELLPRLLDEPFDDDAVDDVVYEAAETLGVQRAELDRLIKEGTPRELFAALGLDEQSVTDAAVAAARAGIDSLEADGVLDATSATAIKAFLPEIVAHAVESVFSH